MPDARAAFLDHARTIQQYATLRLSEADTRSYLIDPVLRILGYEGVDHLRREVPVPATKVQLSSKRAMELAPRGAPGSPSTTFRTLGFSP